MDAEERRLPFCPNCGKEVRPEAAFCPSCEYNLKSAAPSTPSAAKPSAPLEHKSPGVPAVLALVLGLFGLMGVGHIYVGRLKRGLLLLMVGIVLASLTYGSMLLGFVTFGLGWNWGNSLRNHLTHSMDLADLQRLSSRKAVQ